MTRPLLPDANGSAVRAAVVQRNRLLGSFLITLRMLPNISNSYFGRRVTCLSRRLGKLRLGSGRSMDREALEKASHVFNPNSVTTSVTLKSYVPRNCPSCNTSQSVNSLTHIPNGKVNRVLL